MYKGKEKCQGCGKSGADRPRRERESLCKECDESIRAGRSIQHEAKMEYVSAFLHYNSFEREVNDFAQELLGILHNENAKIDAYVDIASEWGNNGRRHNIEKSLVGPISGFFTKMDKKYKLLAKSIAALPDRARQEVEKERDEIYNKGIEKGKNLLFMLESGDISMNDFAERLKYHK